MAGVWIAGASGIVLFALGGLLLLARPFKPYLVTISVFLISWGTWVICTNVWRGYLLAAQPTAAHHWFLVSCALLTVLYLPLIFFALTYPVSHGFLKHRPWSIIALVMPAVAGALLFWISPTSFTGGFHKDVQTLASDLGSAYYVYYGLLSFAFYAALLELHRYRRSATTDIERRRTGHVILAFITYLAYTTADIFSSGIATLLLHGWTAIQPSGLLFLATPMGAVILAWTTRGLITGPRSSRFGPNIFLLIAPAAVGGFVAGATRTGIASYPIETLGLWRIGFALLLGYGLLRFQIVDLERRLEKTLTVASFWGLGAGISVVILGGLEASLGSSWAVLLVWAAFAAVLTGLLFHLSREYWKHSPRTAIAGWSSPRRQEKMRQDVYEAFLVESCQRCQGRDIGKAPQLARLRSQLGVSDSEHNAILQIALGFLSAAPGPELDCGDWVAERYQVERRMGRGGFGQAFLAWDSRLARRVVVKLLNAPRLSANHARAFLREARLAARAEHPNLVRMYDFGFSGQYPYMVLEHAKGENLEHRVRHHGALKPADSVRIMRGVLRGLSALHAEGVVHGDLKAANIVTDSNGSPRITDFGVAVLQDSLDNDALAAAGSPAFMSPEAASRQPLTPGSDVYSAGALFYYLVAGQPYLDLDGYSLEEMREAVLSQPPRPLTRPGSFELAPMVYAALSKDPDERPQSAQDYLQALLELRLKARLTRPRTKATSGPAVVRRLASTVPRRLWAEETN